MEETDVEPGAETVKWMGRKTWKKLGMEWEETGKGMGKGWEKDGKGMGKGWERDGQGIS